MELCEFGVPLSHSDLTEFFHDNLPKVDSSLIFLPITLMPKSQLLYAGAESNLGDRVLDEVEKI